MNVITTTDKDQRDKIFADLRANGDAGEKQAVKFSDVEVIPPVEGGPVGYRTVWGVAHPMKGGE